METTREVGESCAEHAACIARGARRTLAPQGQAGGEVRGNRSQILVEQEALILFLMLTRTTACIHTEELHDVAVIEDHLCATVEDKPVTIRVTQATDKEGPDDWQESGTC